MSLYPPYFSITKLDNDESADYLIQHNCNGLLSFIVDCKVEESIGFLVIWAMEAGKCERSKEIKKLLRTLV